MINTANTSENIILSPIADSYTNEASPDTNYNSDSKLLSRASGGAVQHSYVTFYVPHFVDSATISMYIESGTGTADIILARTSPDWDENVITWNTGLPIKERWQSYEVARVPSVTKGWVTWDVSSVVSEPGYYSFQTRSSYGHSQMFCSTNAAANNPYMAIKTREPSVNIVHNTKTNNDLHSFIVEQGDEIIFTISPDNAANIISYTWFVNKENQDFNSKNFEFIVPFGIEGHPQSEIWEIRVEGTYTNGSKIIREWLISSLSEDEAPEFIDFFIDRDNRWRTGYISDPWGRMLPHYSLSDNYISDGYYTGSDTSTGKVLQTKFNVTSGTFKFKIKNPGILQNMHFKVIGEPRTTFDNSLSTPQWAIEWTANEFHDYFALRNEYGYIPASRRALGQAPGVHWWRSDDDEWRDITIIKTEDGWYSVWENDVLLPHSHANFEDAFNNATKLNLAANSILQMDCIQVYENKYIYPLTTIEYRSYGKWWSLSNPSTGDFSPVDDEGIVVSGRNVTLKQISDSLANPDYMTYNSITRTAVLKKNLSLYDGSELIINNETLIVETTSQSLGIDLKVGVTLRITDSTIIATNYPFIWNFASSISQNVFNPDNTRELSAGSAKRNPINDYRGIFVVENSIIDNTGNLFLDAPYEVRIRNVVFSNHSSIDYGDYSLRGAYENHNQKKRQSYGEKGLWIVPRIDLTSYVVENITFVDSKNDISLKVIGGEWIQDSTTIKDSDLRGVDIIAMKALKHEYYITYRNKNEKSTFALLNALYDEAKLSIGGHPRSVGTYEYDEAEIVTKYYFDTIVKENSGNNIENALIMLDSSNPLCPAESLHEYRHYISDFYTSGEGGVTNYGAGYFDENGNLVGNMHNITYTGGTHTRWANALPLGTAVTDSNGHTALPGSDDPKNSIVLIDYVLTSDAGTLKKESLTYTLNVNAPSGQSVSLTGISPDPTWYREDPNIPTYTITAIVPDNSTSGPNIIGFAPSEDNPFVPGSTKKFRVWTDEILTNMNWYVDGVQASSGSLEYDWSILEGSHTINFEGANGNGAVIQSWSVTGRLQVPEDSKVPESSGSGTSYTPSATSFTASMGSSTTFSVDSEEQFTSTQWYFNGEPVASDTTSYTQNWDASGSFTVSFEGTTDLGTMTRTWNVVVSGSEYSAISIVPSASVVAPGETFSLDVYIDPKQPVTGAQLNLHYSTLASVTAVRDGGLFKVDGLTSTFQGGLIDNSAGVVRDVYSAITGSGKIGRASCR